MGVIQFPPNPSPGEQYSVPNGPKYEWDGDKWVCLAGSGGGGGGGGGLNPIPNDTVLGNVSGAEQIPNPLTGSQVTALLTPFDATDQGVVPAPGAADPGTNVLLSSGAWGSASAGIGIFPTVQPGLVPAPGASPSSAVLCADGAWATGMRNPTTVSGLPAPSLQLRGTRATITDSQRLTGVVVGGATSTVPVFCDGTNWISDYGAFDDIPIAIGADTTLLPGNRYVAVNASTQPITITMPPALSLPSGQFITLAVAFSGTNMVTVNNSTGSLLLQIQSPQRKTYQLFSNFGGWWPVDVSSPISATIFAYGGTFPIPSDMSFVKVDTSFQNANITLAAISAYANGQQVLIHSVNSQTYTVTVLDSSSNVLFTGNGVGPNGRLSLVFTNSFGTWFVNDLSSTLV